MFKRIYSFLAIILLLQILLGPGPVYAANFIWNQTDWSLHPVEPDPTTARHPADQNGWNRFYAKDPYMDTSIPEEVSLSPQPASWTQTGDIGDFDQGILSNLRLVGGGTQSVVRYQETSSAVTRNGTWGSVSGNPDVSGGGFLYSTTAGSAVSFTFTGTEVKWISFTYSNGGTADVYLDDNFQERISLFSTGSPQYKKVVWGKTGLTPTPHTLRIVVVSAYVWVDAFDVLVIDPDEGAYLTLVDIIKSWTQTGDKADFDQGILNDVKIVGQGTQSLVRYEETSSAVTRSGTWGSVSGNPDVSGGGFLYSTTAGSAVSFTFTGYEVRWISFTYSNGGTADVYLDDNFQERISLFSTGSPQYKKAVWGKTGLTPTPHTLRIVVVSAYVWVDAFDVLVPNPDNGAYLMLVDGVTSGVYESPSFDSGPDGASFSTITWFGTIPAGTSIRFQIASNDDNQVWNNFVGPDGTDQTFYESSTPGVAIPISGHSRVRYIRYRAFFDRPTADSASPVLDAVTIEYGTIHGVYESPSFDVGPGGAFYTSIERTADVPPGSSLRFQIATNNDNSTWNFEELPGEAGYDYVTSGAVLNPGHNGRRYIKYRAIFDRPIADPTYSPILYDVTINYKANPPFQSLTGSPYNTMAVNNAVRRLMWSEDLPSGTDDIALQIRTSPDGTDPARWGSWYGPHSTAFSASMGVSQITVVDTAGFSVGGSVTLTNSADITKMEVKKIKAINETSKLITLNSATSYTYAPGSSFTDMYDDPAGAEEINPLHRSGDDDQWIQYRVFLFTGNGTVSPRFLENRIGYLPADGVYQPDGIIDGDRDGPPYGASGSGGGGTSAKDVDPRFVGGQVTYNIEIQNDGSAPASDPSNDRDIYTVTYNTPSDASGSWTVSIPGLIDEDPLLPGTQITLRTGETTGNLQLMVIPSSFATADLTQNVTVDIRSENEYGKVDSIRATATVNRVYQADGVIGIVQPDGGITNENGDGPPYDPANTGHDPSGLGNGGSASQSGRPGDTVKFSIKIENEGNIRDRYTVSQTSSCVDINNLPRTFPSNWKILINDGTQDYDITSTPVSLPQPQDNYLPATTNISAISSAGYTLKVLPVGEALTCNTILQVKSVGNGAILDSIKATTILEKIYRVDLWIDGKGDNIYYNPPASPNGGETAKQILPGVTGSFRLAVQNEGNVMDYYEISWVLPAGWVTTVLYQDGSTACTTSPCIVHLSDLTCPYKSGSQCLTIPGEVIPLEFQVKPPDSFTSFQPIEIRVRSMLGNSEDRVNATVSATDNIPPNAVQLNLGVVGPTSVQLKWKAPGDDGNSGRAASYDLRYSVKHILDDPQFEIRCIQNEINGGFCTNADKNKLVYVTESLEKITFSRATAVSGLPQPQESGTDESFTVPGLFANTDYSFVLKTADESGNISPLSSCSFSGCRVRTEPSADSSSPGAIQDLRVTDTSRTYSEIDRKSEDRITLCWTAPADDGTTNSSGSVTAYDLGYDTRWIVDDGVIIPPAEQDSKVNFGSINSTQQVLYIGASSPGITECRSIVVRHPQDINLTPNTPFYFALKAQDERGASGQSVLSNVARGMTGMLGNAYNMASIPGFPSPNTLKDVFEDDVGSPLYLYRWNSSGMEPEAGCYDGRPGPTAGCSTLPDPDVEPGRGYYLWSPRMDIILDAIIVVEGKELDIPEPDITPYPICVEEGWNMIGDPFQKPVAVRDTRVRERVYAQDGISYTDTDLTFVDAVTAGLVGGAIYTYNGVDNSSWFSYDEPITISSLIPWRGYWFYLKKAGVDCKETNLAGKTKYYLLIDKPQP